MSPVASRWRRRAPGHRARGVEHDHGPEVGLLLELLDVEPVVPPEYLPVHVPQLVARLVHPVLGKFHGKAAPR
jgi:hypothetical protein